jgi:catechol 2,3-dioxygenase-like lactoylglutathione lyase family enzyme
VIRDNQTMPLNHVVLTVADSELSAAFYGEHFGLTERIMDDEHLLILGSADRSELALSDGEPVPPELPRTNHFGFRVAGSRSMPTEPGDASVRRALGRSGA